MKCRRFFCSFVFWIFLFFTFLLSASASQPICLNMIVKNERAVICRCLASVKPFIDYWVIVDTGSTDGTQAIIKEYMKDIPGELHERPWKNFAHNRNEALELAQGKGAYFLFMDADDWLEYRPGFQWPHLTHDLYTMWRRGDSFSFVNHQLVSSALPWTWVGVVHEHLHCGQPYTHCLLEDVWYHVENDGSSHSDPEKFHKYAALLEESLAKDPNNMRDQISLAKTYKGAKLFEKALQAYEKIVATCMLREELFWAWLEIGNMKILMGRPLDESISAYYKAHRLYPERAEPVYLLSELYNRQGRFDLAYACIQGQRCISKGSSRGVVFNLDWMERYGIVFELSICAFFVDQYEEALHACDTLLAMKNLPEDIRMSTEKNRQRILKNSRLR